MLMPFVILSLLPLVLAESEPLIPLPERLPGSSSEFFDVLDSGKAEWRLVFRGTARAGTSVLAAYKAGQGIPQNVADACKGVDFRQECKTHYRNTAALEDWNNIRNVMFGIVKDGSIVRTLIFNGANTGYMSWFSKCDLTSTCYSDIISQPKNYFSIQGEHTKGVVQRHFFLNRNDGSCESQAGWFVALDGPDRSCQWEKKFGQEIPIFLFSPSLTYTNWDHGTKAEADAIVIFVRYGSGVSPPVVRPVGPMVKPCKRPEKYDVMGTGRNEYRLVFRGCARINKPMYKAYKEGTGVTFEIPCLGLDPKAACDSHFRNHDALDTWGNIQEVLVQIIKDGAVVKSIKFNGEGTNYISWFSDKYLIKDASNGWTDLMKGPYNFFSLEGHPDITDRRFFINRNYGGCPNDYGWLTVSDSTGKPCDWEKYDSFPNILYAPDTQAVKWEKGTHGEADALAIYVKYFA